MLVIATFGKSISNAQKRWVEAVEKRVSVTTEILTSMKGIKMSGLSKYSSALLQGLRETVNRQRVNGPRGGEHQGSCRRAMLRPRPYRPQLHDTSCSLPAGNNARDARPR